MRVALSIEMVFAGPFRAVARYSSNSSRVLIISVVQGIIQGVKKIPILNVHIHLKSGSSFVI